MVYSTYLIFGMIFKRQLSSSLISRNSLTFFTKETCQLCTNAKEILGKTLSNPSLKNKKVDLEVIDIMKPENSKWFDVYCFDVPVLHIMKNEEQKKPIKFMHYFHEDKILEELNK